MFRLNSRQVIRIRPCSALSPLEFLSSSRSLHNHPPALRSPWWRRAGGGPIPRTDVDDHRPDFGATR